MQSSCSTPRRCGCILPACSGWESRPIAAVPSLWLPYWLVVRVLRVVSPQEEGTIRLLEPLLNPLWAYLVSPESEKPTFYTLLGGACIIGALAWRYWPLRRPKLP